MSLIITAKWNELCFGYESSEEEYIEYLKTKNFVYCTIDLGNDTLDELNEFIEFNTSIDENVKLKIAKNIYTYKNRSFANLNLGIEKLQQNFKKHQKKKMAYCRNPRNLLNREITGKFRYH